jgi:scyllo-inositol 2-dehydrogenase (NADP+)
MFLNKSELSDFLAVKQVIESGRLGSLIEVTFRMDRYKHELSPKKFKEDPEMKPNGLLYDLGPHLIDQAIALFGRPLSFHKVMSTHREQSQVDDYFSIQMSFPHQLNVTVASGLLIAQPLPAYVVHGTLGSFIKERCDTQEDQLDAGMKPWAEGFGVEPAGSDGVLVLRGLEDKREVEHVPSLLGDYNGLFDAVHNTIRNGALYPVTEEQLAWQLEILEA